ncbi:MAG: DUF2523 domain-containing protein [Rhodocyclaceae bacterium]
MPMFIAALLGGLIQIAATLAGRVLIGIGIGFVTFTGVMTMLGKITDGIVTRVNGLPTEMIQLLGVMQLDTDITIFTTALVVRMTLNGLSADGAIKRMVQK